MEVGEIVQVNCGHDVTGEGGAPVIRPGIVVHVWGPECVDVRVMSGGPRDEDLLAFRQRRVVDGLLGSATKGDGVGQYVELVPGAVRRLQEYTDQVVMAGADLQMRVDVLAAVVDAAVAPAVDAAVAPAVAPPTPPAKPKPAGRKAK